MAKKDKAIYAPGELNRIRNNLGITDPEEAKRLSEKLGGEIGYERSSEPEKVRHERVDVKIGNQRQVRKRIELAGDVPPNADDESGRRAARRSESDPADDPSVPLKYSYWDRIKMDRYAAQNEFEIKSSSQVIFAMLSIFGEGPDFVNPVFVTQRIAEYYNKIETMVVSTRSLFPRNNILRNERMKKNAPVAFAILDTIRYWNIERISGDIAKLAARPGSVKVKDFADILRAVYRPLFILERLDMEAHIRASYKILYKALYIENPMDAQEKYQPLIRTALAAFAEVNRDIRYLMYPLFLKMVSSKWIPYERFFAERKNRIMAFLNISENEQLKAAQPVAETKNDDAETTAAAEDTPGDDKPEEEKKELTEEEKTRQAAEEAERKALDRGIQTLELLFPKAGWDRIASYPDFYPYFVDVLDLKRGVVNIAPTDPLLQVFILMRIIEELLFALRYVSFGTIAGPGGNPERIDDSLMRIINDWHYFVEMSFEKEYLPRLLEYVRILEGSLEERNSQYTKKLISDMHWIKRLYLLPYYKFESLAVPSMQKKDVISIYPEIKKMRRLLTAVAAGIEKGNRTGGAEGKAHCDGIDNPWEPYTFQVPNPLSLRLDALLGPKNKNNASLVYFTLAVTVVLDHLVNSEDSWAYGSRPGPLFRSINGEGIQPLTGVDDDIDAEYLFRASLKNRGK